MGCTHFGNESHRISFMFLFINSSIHAIYRFQSQHIFYPCCLYIRPTHVTSAIHHYSLSFWVKEIFCVKSNQLSNDIINKTSGGSQSLRAICLQHQIILTPQTHKISKDRTPIIFSSSIINYFKDHNNHNYYFKCTTRRHFFSWWRQD